MVIVADVDAELLDGFGTIVTVVDDPLAVPVVVVLCGKNPKVVFKLDRDSFK